MGEIFKKRIKEAALEGSKHYDPNVSLYSQGKNVGYIRGFEDGAEFALSHQWISVEEALPERGYEVLVLDKRHETQIAVYIGLEWWHNPIGYEKVYPIYWMPIPELKAQRRR